MGKSTEISWCHHTFNPWWGCQRVSPGCENCYAETLAKRWGYDIWGPPKTTERRLFGDAHWREPIGWDLAAAEAGERRRVFCASMADVFEDHAQVVTSRYRLWSLIESTPNLDWLLLTKRPENIAHMLPQGYWPNVWLGTSTEDQQRADERVPVLLRYRDRVPVLFLSVEPQIGPVSLDQWLWPDCGSCGHPVGAHEPPDTVIYPCDTHGCGCRGYITGCEPAPITPALRWVIVGGESGPKHRPFDLDWARSLRDECQAAGVAFFFKQVGGRTHAAGGDLLDGREHKQFPEPAREPAHA